MSARLALNSHVDNSYSSCLYLLSVRVIDVDSHMGTHVPMLGKHSTY